jgi:hypothetical protein
MVQKKLNKRFAMATGFPYTTAKTKIPLLCFGDIEKNRTVIARNSLSILQPGENQYRIGIPVGAALQLTDPLVGGFFDAENGVRLPDGDVPVPDCRVGPPVLVQQ